MPITTESYKLKVVNRRGRKAMIVEIKCPDCGGNHFFDIGFFVDVRSIAFGSEEELRQVLLEKVQIRGMIPSRVIEENI